MAAAGARGCLLGVGLLAGLLLLAGVCQLVCGLYLLLKAPRPAVNGATIVAGLWDVLVGLLAALLCFTAPLRASRRSQLQLAALCSAPVVNAPLGVLLGLAPNTPSQADVNTVCLVLAVTTAAAAVLAFVAGNVVFLMQLMYDQYRPGTRAWESPKSACSAASGFLFSQGQMTQKPGAPDLWLSGSGAVPLASWVYRTQSSVETATCETKLDAPPTTPLPRSSCGSLALRTAPGSEGEPARLPRCLSLLSAIYGPSRGGWPPTGQRPPLSRSLLEVRPAEPRSPAPFPPAPAPLCASPLPTPVAERPPPETPLAGTIGRLTSALSRLHSDPNYRASRELQEALQALEALQATPTPAAPRPASSGYGSPEGPPEPEPERRSVVQLVSLLEAGRPDRRADTPLRRPTVPPPPPPPPGSGATDSTLLAADSQQIGPVPAVQATEVTADDRPNRPRIESEC